MKRVNILSLSSVLMAMGVVGIACAQSQNVGISVRGGVVFPTSSSISSGSGSTWFGFGAEYRLLKLDPESEFHPTLSLSLDYFSRNSVNETPILLNYVIHKDSFFGSVGAGVSYDHQPFSSTTHFGYQVGVGYNLPTEGIPLFVEAKFWGNDNSDYNAVGVYVGVKF